MQIKFLRKTGVAFFGRREIIRGEIFSTFYYFLDKTNRFRQELYPQIAELVLASSAGSRMRVHISF